MTRDIETYKKLQRRSLILGLSKTFFTLIVLSKLYYLQILNKSKYGKLSDINRIKIKILYPERGRIFDLYGDPIAENRIDFQLNLFREKRNLIDQYIKKLKKIIRFDDLDLLELKKNLKSDNVSDFIILKKNLSWKELEIFELLSNKFPFLFITKEKVRNYTDELVFSHVLGYVGYQKNSDNKKLVNLKVGISGIEKVYNDKLIGSHGWEKIETNSSGRNMKKLQENLSLPGKNIQTNLISEVQNFSFKQLHGMSGSVVLMDCETGGVNCLVSTPSFNNNNFSNGVSTKEWKRLLNDKSNPLLNRSVAGLYSPGSTFKLMTAMYALNNGFNRETKFSCPGFVELGSHKFHCWKKGGHGLLNMFEGIKQSCDCYFYNLAKEIEIDSLAKLARNFSLGIKTGIDLPNESIGIMPNRAWKRSNKGEKWHLGETFNTVIGQGFTLSTPLQITTMTARIASGTEISPILMRTKNGSIKHMNYDEKNLEFIRQTMFSVVNEIGGTAYSSRLSGNLFMAGKTGTSQVRRITKMERESESGVLENKELPYELRDHSIFTCFAPFDKPKFALTVLIEHMGSGSKVAAPIAKKILELALKKYY